MKMAATSSTRATRRRPTSSHDAEGFFTVGDIGYLNDDGYLFLCDRKSDMIIAGGINIYPAEIEGCIHEHPQVADVAVFGIPDDDMGEQIKAVVQPLPGVAGDDALRASIMEHVREKLGKYKWPRSIDFMDELPREPTGKLLKRKLRDPYWEGRDRDLMGPWCCDPDLHGGAGARVSGRLHALGRPVIGRFLTGLRDGRILAVRLADGRVLVPPTEYDPATSGRRGRGRPLDRGRSARHGAVVHLGRATAEGQARSRSRSRSRSSAPTAPTPRSCTWSTAAVRTRSRSVHGSRRVGAPNGSAITDIEAWMPLGDGEEPEPAPLHVPADDEQPVTGITVPISLKFVNTAGESTARYLVGLGEGKIIGGRAPNSTDVYADHAAPIRRPASRRRSRSRSATPA